MKQTICWLRTIKWTLVRWFYSGDLNIWVDGHIYIESKPFRTKNGIATKFTCKVCGHILK